MKRSDLAENWVPESQTHLTVWASTQHLLRRLTERNISAAAELAQTLGGMADTARELAYRLYSVSERKGWTGEAGNYNALVVSWPEIKASAEEFALKA